MNAHLTEETLQLSVSCDPDEDSEIDALIFHFFPVPGIDLTWILLILGFPPVEIKQHNNKS